MPNFISKQEFSGIAPDKRIRVSKLLFNILKLEKGRVKQ
jgi:hypothetical protein